MTYFQHTKRDLAEAREDARREVGEVLLALADDTDRKLNSETPEFDRQMLAEDIVARLVQLAKELGADVTLYGTEVRPVPAYELIPNVYHAGVTWDVYATRAADLPKPIPSTVNGYPVHEYVPSGHGSCGAMVVSTWNMSGDPVKCYRAKNTPIHRVPEDSGTRTPHVFESAHSPNSCTAMYVDGDGFGDSCGFPASHPIHIKES